ncbi:MAG: tyrosine-type recombinase/integrase [Flavobacteriaceae bacterium]|nr:tyrosine-type recombinase/integrase [Flavobacteriaceae bacterium]
MKKFFDYLTFEKKLSSNTIVAYRNDLETCFSFCQTEFEINDLAEAEYSMIRKWIVKLSNDGLSELSINRKASALKSYYKFLIRIGDLKISPMQAHKKLKTQKKLLVPFTEEEVNRVINEAFDDTFEGQRDSLMIETFYSTGIRRAELIKLKVSDVYFSKKLIKVQGKRNKDRLIPMLPGLMKKIQSYLEYRKKVVTDPSQNELFVTSKGKRMNPTLVYRRIRAYFSVASTKVRKSPHILRHTFATHLLNKGADINTIKEILGHLSLASTQEYAKVRLPKIVKDYQEAHPREQLHKETSSSPKNNKTKHNWY